MIKVRGFTLIETVLSVAIMGLVIITVLGVFVHGINAIKKGRYALTATNVAEKKISEVRNLLAKYQDPNTDLALYIVDNIESTDSFTPSTIKIWNKLTIPVKIHGTENIGKTGDFTFNILLEDYIPSSGGALAEVKYITVAIYGIDPISGVQRKTQITT